MCGIIAAVARGNVVPALLEGLKRLEYRGYDSAGIAVVINGTLQRIRSTGRVQQLERLAHGVKGEIGVAHTRWATHGAPSERNAHPHVSGGISVVHNGIIENHESLRGILRARGYTFESETDTEVIAHLVHLHRANGSTLFDAVRRSTAELSGAFALAVIDEADPVHLVVVRHGAPLLVGLGELANFAASDTSALAHVTQRIIYLEDGDCGELSPADISIADMRGNMVRRPVRQSEQTAAATQLGSYQRYMQKEIFEQPAAVTGTLEMIASAKSVSPRLFGPDAGDILGRINGVLILACGTSYHAGLVARHWIEDMAGIPCNVEIASEYRYLNSVPDEHALVVTISQSGETADTIAASRHAMNLGHQHSLCICNVAESTLLRASELRFLTRAGPEIGVASTKAFTTQLVALILLAAVIAKLRARLSPNREATLLRALGRLPSVLTRALETEAAAIEWARKIVHRDHALFLGRGIHYPIAMEGALKLKEISYIHAEAYPAGELKHGPLALVDSTMPVFAIVPKGELAAKVQSNLHEVRARGGELYVLTEQDDEPGNPVPAHVIRVPGDETLLSPIVHTIPLQLLAYHAALMRGNDVDKPRNLAKSVTVE